VTAQTQDDRMKAKGYRYKVTARIHPKIGGNTYRIFIYYRKPPPDDKDIQRTIKTEGSAILTDFIAENLP